MKNKYIKLTTLLVLFVFSLPSFSASWITEAEKNGYVKWIGDSIADIHAPGGLTLWNSQQLQGNVTIEYEARIVSDGRISDLNCFWMANDPKAKDVFVNLKKRGGTFLQSYALELYYLGFGGNHNSTTRFRRYNGDERGITQSEYRPAILREYTDSNHLIKKDHWYKIHLEAIDGHIRYIIDGECLVDFVDPHPIEKGYFGFRTTLSHAQLRNYKVTMTKTASNTIIAKSIGNNSRNISTPLTFGIPFSQGELKEGDKLLVSSSSPTPSSLKTDQWTLATWPDGSVKWKAIATVCPPQMKSIEIRKSKSIKKAKSLGAHKTDTIPSWLKNIEIEQNGMILPIYSINNEQNGYIRSCWRIEGKNFVARAYKYKGSDEIKMVFTHFIDSITNKEGLSSLSVRVKAPLHDVMHQRTVAFLTNNQANNYNGASVDNTSLSTYKMSVKPLVARRNITLNNDGTPADSLSKNILNEIAAWDGFRLSQLSPNAYSIRKRATSISPWIGTKEGYRAPGIVAIGDRNSSFAVALDDFWQSYPSTLQVDNARSDTAVISIYLWSKEAERMQFTHYDTIPHGLNAAYEDIQPGMSTAYGIARTSTIYFYTSSISIDSLCTVLPEISKHPQFCVEKEYLHRKRAFGIWSIDNNTELDKNIKDIVRLYLKEQEDNSWYGYLNYGDFMHTYDSIRGEWRYDVGGFAWDNTELATPSMLWYQFLRTGDYDTYRLAVAMNRHNAEVDCYHLGLHKGLGTRHNVLHWGCGAKEARISQAYWNRFLYYLSADERMGEIMQEVTDADQQLYTLDPMRLAQPRSTKYPCTAPARLRIGPDWLAYAGNWFTEWERTGNTVYRDKILNGMKSITSMPNGIFTGPKALGYDPATGVISWEGNAEVQNTNHLLSIMGGFEFMNEIMLSLTTPEWNKIWLEHAALYKEKAITISNNKFLIPRLQGYAWWLTGNRNYLSNAYHDLHRNNPFKTKGSFYTNTAATYVLDAIFIQEVAK